MSFKIKFVIVLAGALSVFLYADTLTLESLYHQMIDLNRLPQFPEACYKVVQYSSYDRRSGVPNGPGWFLNSDGFGSEPIPGFEAVIKEPDSTGIGLYQVCDIKQPGALIRFWSARMSGTIRLYLDNSREPVFEGPAEEFFIRTYNQFAQKANVEKGIFENSFQQEYSCYFPIPFRKRCTVTWEGSLKDTHFYHLQARIYDKNAEIETFTLKNFKNAENTIQQIAEVLRNPSENFNLSKAIPQKTFTETIKPDEYKLLTQENQGPKAIKQFEVRIKAENLYAALRSTILYIQFDDYSMPQIQSPIGDFFAAAPGINPLDSLPFTVKKDGTMSCRFVMPFKNNVKIFAFNLGKKNVQVTGKIFIDDYTWTDNTMHFYARWRINSDVTTVFPTPSDIPFIIAKGQGRFVGTSLMLYNTSNIPGGGGNWWGEGDEKIFIDNDKFPSTFGTGTEDYFNYAWGRNTLFNFAFCGQPRSDGPATRGYNVNYRFQIADDMLFKKTFAFYMELMTHDINKDFSYARIPYYYGINLLDDHKYITNEEVREPIFLPWSPVAKLGAASSTFFEAETSLSENKAKIIENIMASNGRYILFKPNHENDSISFKFNIKEAGQYKVSIVGLASPEMGSAYMQIKKDDQLIGKSGSFDYKSNFHTMLRRRFGPILELQEGSHILSLVSHDAKPLAIDFIWLAR